MVIVILGILAAFALPRFADLSGSANQAIVEGAGGAMKSAASVVNLACRVRLSCDPSQPATAGTGNSIVLEGQTINLVYGYPRASPAGIFRAASMSPEDYTVTTITSGGSTTGVRIRPTDGGYAAGECEVSYLNPTGPGQAPVINILTPSC